ncbi:Nucleoside recognition [Falsiruegeria litorea R37]|uniref:Nucleoside recognition n=1 Tax=Falsiruegeria litorea R37 TaxID=1200284 RepID=A0A1Y5TZ50_9RHOB|nr:nucleoside recognition domain-containing protein [Falsiruegeria litorea]SLN71751.1 Nucleoside recognition [Falsiruegeria litorea R37]
MTQSSNRYPTKGRGTEHSSISVGLFLKCVVPSLIGLILFLVPLNIGGEYTIPLVYLANFIVAVLGKAMHWILLLVLTISFVLPLVMRSKRASDDVPLWLEPLVCVTWFTILVRAVGTLFLISVMLKTGPQAIWSEFTGEIIVDVVIIKLMAILFLAALLLPMLTEYGLMDFAGALLVTPFRILFRLPGRAAVDSMSSILGSASVGIILSSRQYEMGLYSRREAAIIASCFSMLAIPFSVVLADIAGIMDYYIQYYLASIGILLVLAMILARIPPLSLIEDSFYNGIDNRPEEVSEDGHIFARASEAALQRGKSGPDLGTYLTNSIRDLVGMWCNILPPVLTFATIAMVVVEYSSFFQWVAVPFVPLVQLLGLEFASDTATAVITGVADPLFPVLIGADIPSEVNRVAIAIMGLVQLIFMTETGVVLMKSKIDFKLWRLVTLFMLRLIIGFPLAVAAAYLIV